MTTGVAGATRLRGRGQLCCAELGDRSAFLRSLEKIAWGDAEELRELIDHIKADLLEWRSIGLPVLVENQTRRAVDIGSFASRLKTAGSSRAPRASRR